MGYGLGFALEEAAVGVFSLIAVGCIIYDADALPSWAVTLRRAWASRRRLYGWLRGNRILAVILALGLVAVPTGFGIFPHLTDVLSRRDREWIMFGWTVAAVLTGFAAAVDKEEAEQRVLEGQRLLRKQAVRAALAQVPSWYRATVYIFDEKAGCLFPWYPHSITDRNDPRVFLPGNGATGLAYQSATPIAVVGDAVSNAEHHLTPAQQAYFADYDVVVAVRVTKPENDAPLGVLSLIATLNDETYVTDDRDVQTVAMDKLEDLADEIGEILSPGRLL